VPDPTSPQITQILNSPDPPDSAALLTLVYDQLRKIAQQRMNDERGDHTLQATALVHEAYLRLVGDQPLEWDSRAHFFAAAAEAMRRILVEHARARNRLKRGGDADGRPSRRVPIRLLDLADEQADPEEILMLDDALRRLESEDPNAARVVRLRFFAGLTGDQAAAALGVSPATVDREWTYSRARLHRLMSERSSE
jgi:RNA polymerase sigma factor (TIGR02999 family)